MRSVLLLLVVLIARSAHAQISAAEGDVSPGVLDTSTSPPTWRPTGDDAITVADVVTLLRASVGLQVMPPGESDCPEDAPVLGDAAPGAASSSTQPPRWVDVGDGVLDVADVVVVLRAAVELHVPSLQTGLPVGASLVGFECPVLHAVGAQSVEVRLRRTDGLGQQACVQWATEGGTAEPGPDGDYDSATGTACFDPGETEASFFVNVHPEGSGGEIVLLRANAPASPEPSILAALVLQTVRPVARVSPPRLRLGMPENCPQAFQVSNVGPPGSILQFSVADDGALGGFLDVQTGPTSLGSGQSSTVTVKVKPEFVDDVVGADLVLHVNVPDAANYVQWPQMVRVRSNTPLGAWGGTWRGVSVGPQSQETPVAGSWSLQLDGYDLAAGTAVGTLHWAGYDAYWSSSQGAFVAFPGTARSRTFGPDNATFRFLTTPQRPCGVYQLDIENDAFNPSDAFYGPAFGVQLDAAAGTVPDGPFGGSCGCGPAGNFEAHPYDPSTMATGRSVGRVQGGR